MYVLIFIDILSLNDWFFIPLGLSYCFKLHPFFFIFDSRGPCNINRSVRFCQKLLRPVSRTRVHFSESGNFRYSWYEFDVRGWSPDAKKKLLRRRVSEGIGKSMKNKLPAGRMTWLSILQAWRERISLILFQCGDPSGPRPGSGVQRVSSVSASGVSSSQDFLPPHLPVKSYERAATTELHCHGNSCLRRGSFPGNCPGKFFFALFPRKNIINHLDRSPLYYEYSVAVYACALSFPFQ